MPAETTFVQAHELIKPGGRLRQKAKAGSVKSIILKALDGMEGLVREKCSPDLIKFVMSLIENTVWRKRGKEKVDKKQMCLEIVEAVCKSTLTAEESKVVESLIQFIHQEGGIEVVGLRRLLWANGLRVARALFF
jgi:hypothetical protein